MERPPWFTEILKLSSGKARAHCDGQTCPTKKVRREISRWVSREGGGGGDWREYSLKHCPIKRSGGDVRY